MEKEKITKHIYIKEGDGKKYYQGIIYGEDSISVGRHPNGQYLTHLNGCTIMSTEDHYDGGWHDYYVYIGTDEKKNLDSLIKKIEQEDIRWRED